MAEIKPMGNCPTCGHELKKLGHQPGGAKGRYKCVNQECRDRRWFNRSGEVRPGAA